MRKRKIGKIVIIVVAVAAIGFGGWGVYKKFFSHKNDRMPMMMENTLTEVVSKGSMQETITASGSVLLKDEIEVYAEGETNKIKSILVEEGDYVQEGEILVEYDVDDTEEELENKIRDLKVDIQNAQLSLESIAIPVSDSELTKLENQVASAEKSVYESQVSYDNYDTKISQQQSTISQAKTDMERAEKTVSDNETLLAIGGVTQTEYDDSIDSYNKAVTTYETAVSDLEQLEKDKENARLNLISAQNSLKEAQNELEDSKDVFSDESVRIKYEQQKLSLQSLETSLADYEKDLSELVYSTASSVSGIVTEVCVDEGTYTEENTVILMVADFDELIVSANIEEYDAPLVAVGQKVEMTSDGIADKVYKGTITKVDNSASSATSMMGTETVVPIEISVDNPDGILKPNYSLDLEITVVDKEDVLCVSSSAVGYDGETETYYVFKEENGVVNKTTIEVGDTGDTTMEVVSGLNEGDVIIASVSDEITDGMRLDELMNNNQQQQQRQESSDGGQENDRNQGFNQMLPSGGAGGNGPGGGMSQGGRR